MEHNSLLQAEEINLERIENETAAPGKLRFVILIVSLLHFSTVMASSITFNATYVSIVNKNSSPLFNESNNNNTDANWNDEELQLSERRFTFTVLEKALGFGAMYFGAVCMVFIINIPIGKIGAHRTYIAIGIVTIIITSLTPFLMAYSFPLFIFTRFGCSVSNVFPIIGIVVNSWAPASEKGFFVACLTAYLELSALIAIPLSGIVSSKWGWPYPFYVISFLCAFTTILWTVVYRDNPRDHPVLSSNELRLIEEEKISGKRITTPIGEIFSTISVWACWTATAGQVMTLSFGVSFLSMYMSQGLKYDSLSSGTIPMIPFSILILIKFFTGILSDKIKCISEVNKARLFNSLAMYGSALIFIFIGLSSRFGNFFDAALISSTIVLQGFAPGGYPKAVVLISRQHTPFVMSVLMVVLYASVSLNCLVIPALTEEESFKSWQNVFLLIGIINFLCNSFFLIFISEKPAKWTAGVPWV